MKVFLSYASEDRELADQVQLALTGAGYEVFFDRESLPPAGDYHARIRRAVELSDVFLFLITSNAVAPGSYALTELKYARSKWPHPKGRVLPVRVGNMSWETIPGYLKAVTILEPEGNVAAEVVAAISELERETNQPDPTALELPQGKKQEQPPIVIKKAHKFTTLILVAVIGLIAALGAAVIANWDKIFPNQPTLVKATESEPGTDIKSLQVEVPLDRRALAITTIHETGKPRSYTAVYTFDGDIGYGLGYASLNRGSLYKLLLTYIKTPGTRFAASIKAYLPQLERKDPELIGDVAFKNLLVQVAGEDPIMLKLQDQSIEKGYFEPARKECADIGIQSALGFALIADTFLHSGRGGYEKIKLATTKALDGTPATGVNEKRWLKRFAEERIAFGRHFGGLVETAVERRTDTYIRLMDNNNWDLAAPVSVHGFLLIDP